MPIKYDDWKYANSRLADTYILDDGHISYVKGVSQDTGMAILRKLSKDGLDPQYKKHCNDLDLTPIRLGYVNVTKHCVYTSRTPKRRDYRQGLSGNTLRISSVNNVLLNGFKFHWLEAPALNNYPKFSKCLDNLLAGNRSSQAFSRDFCLHYDGNNVEIHYRGESVVGRVINGAPDLLENFSYLKERLSKHVD